MELAAEVDDHALLELSVNAGANIEEELAQEKGSDSEATSAPDEVRLFGGDDFIDELLHDPWENENEQGASDGERELY